MSSSTSTASAPVESAPPVLYWSRWPLRDQLPGSIWVPLGVALGALGVWYSSGSWLLGVTALLTLIASMPTFFLPMWYEVHAGGFRRRMHGPYHNPKTIPWRLVRCYQPRTTGILLFKRTDPTFLDAVAAILLPYDQDPDELLCAVRQLAPHAEELPADV